MLVFGMEGDMSKRIVVSSRTNTVLFLPWRRYKLKSLGENVRIAGKGDFVRPENIVIGNDVFIEEGFFIQARSAVKIGSGCMLGPRVTIVSGTHNYNSKDLRAVPYDDRYIDAPVSIGDNVWVGANASICPGAHIGEGSVIGMGAIVAGRIPSYSVVVSPKALVLKSRNKDRYRSLVEKDLVYNKVYAGRGFVDVKKEDLLQWE